jgi:hypothetical protein
MNNNLNNLDEKLERSESVHGLVQGLPEETVSLQWRSELNERILATAAQPRRSWLAWAWRPAVGLALTASVAGVIMFRPQPAMDTVEENNRGGEVASVILNAHETSYAYREMGTAMPSGNAVSLANLAERPDDVDLGTL